MTQISKDAFNYLNQLRQNPKIAIPRIQAEMKHFKGNVLHLPKKIPLRTNEGPKAYQECINFLEKQHPIEPMSWSEELEKAAKDHVLDTGPKGYTGHAGTDGSQLDERINRYGQWMSTIGENISYGQNTGEDVIIQLIIDDGIRDRGHRTNCFNKEFKTVGIYDGIHKTYDTMCVFDFAGGMREKGSTQGQGSRQENAIHFNNNAKQFQNLFNQHSHSNQNEINQQLQQMMKQQGSNQHQNNQQDQVPPGCISVNTSTSVSVKNGQKTTTITKVLKFKDGSTQTSVETITEG